MKYKNLSRSYDNTRSGWFEFRSPGSRLGYISKYCGWIDTSQKNTGLNYGSYKAYRYENGVLIRIIG